MKQSSKLMCCAVTIGFDKSSCYTRLIRVSVINQRRNLHA